MKVGEQSRFLHLHSAVNPGKVAALEALQEQYTPYLQRCVDEMMARHRFSVVESERKAFFPRCDALTSQIVKNVRAHAVEIVSGWAASKYKTTLRSHIRELARSGAIDESTRAALCVVGKRSVGTPSAKISQDVIDQYWGLLLDEEVAGRRPTISVRCGMRMSEMTSVLRTSSTTALTSWWLGFSHLVAGRRIHLPIVPSPYIKEVAQASKGILARKTKRGIWRFEVVDKQTREIPELSPSMPKIGVDVGLHVVAATSDGRLLGTSLKPQFDRAYQRIKHLRANRQRQELKENSPRLDRLESCLSGLLKTITGRAANALVAAYPGHAFVIEDLDLRGCRGQKRMAYRALHHSLMNKAPCITVNPAYSSQTCPSCGFVARSNRHATVFACRFCGRRSHADVVGAQNLLRRSEDQEVARVDHPSEVRPILNARHDAWRARHASLCASGRRSRAPAPPGRRLTTRVPRGTGKALNQVLHPAEQV